MNANIYIVIYYEKFGKMRATSVKASSKKDAIVMVGSKSCCHRIVDICKV